MACGDGWEPIIRHLSQRITKIVETVVGPHPNSEDTECIGRNKRSKGGGGRIKGQTHQRRFLIQVHQANVQNTTPVFKPLHPRPSKGHERGSPNERAAGKVARATTMVLTIVWY
jgi:hypothetical protein